MRKLFGVVASKRSCGLLIASAIWLSVAAPLRAADPQLIADAKAFGRRPSAQSVDISPSGRQVLTIDPGPGKSSILTIIDTSTGKERAILTSGGDPEQLYWCKFATDQQLICRFGGGAYYGNDVVGFSRLITLDTNGQNQKLLGQRAHEHDAGLRQFDGEILDWLPDGPGSVLMTRNYVPAVDTIGSHLGDNREGLGVDRIDLATLKSTRVERPQLYADDYLADGRGNVRMMSFSGAGSNDMTGVYSWKYRVKNSKEWLSFSDFDSRSGSGSLPIAVDAGCDCAFVLRKTNGRDALYTIKLDGTLSAQLVANNPNVDIDGIERFGRGQRVIGYNYTDDRGHIVYFDHEFGELAASLGKALPNQPLINFMEAGADGSKLLIIARGDASPGTYYYFDRNTRHLDEVELIRPTLEGRTLARVQTIKVTATDGAQIPAYLTLPINRSPRNMPAVVLPHGGPSARDDWGLTGWRSSLPRAAMR
ncbi:alpha/beta hydrolase family protein [Sphingomonas sp.]|uniref:alpha/beta hydrolase family protein n=1 Tax=Sphingomonas sp. TaxID=28214 RepID=UPI0038ABC09B